MKVRLILILSNIIIICFFSAGCFDAREVDELTYIVGIGLDKGKVKPLRLTVQYVIPALLSGDGGESGGAKALGSLTIEATTIFTALNMANNFIGRQLNTSHAKVIVFSEEIARSGMIDKYNHAFIRGRETRRSIKIAVSRGLAEEYLKSIKPKQEINPAKYYEFKFSNYKFTGFYEGVNYHDFYLNMESLSREAVATLVGVNKNKETSQIDALKSTKSLEEESPMMGNYLAGEIPRSGDIEGETMGLAVFRRNKMVGELDGEEGTLYLMATGNYKNSYMTFDDPRDKNSYVVINLKQSRKPQISVNTNNTKPVVKLKILLEGDFLSIQSGINYEEQPYRDEMEKYLEDYLKGRIYPFLVKTSRIFDSDICGFGDYCKKNFLTQNNWDKYDWSSRYKNVEFDLEVDVKIRRPGLLLKSISIEK